MLKADHLEELHLHLVELVVRAIPGGTGDIPVEQTYVHEVFERGEEGAQHDTAPVFLVDVQTRVLSDSGVEEAIQQHDRNNEWLKAEVLASAW